LQGAGYIVAASSTACYRLLTLITALIVTLTLLLTLTSIPTQTDPRCGKSFHSKHRLNDRIWNYNLRVVSLRKWTVRSWVYFPGHDNKCYNPRLLLLGELNCLLDAIYAYLPTYLLSQRP